jgi:ATP-dependent DNA helicase PIF1
LFELNDDFNQVIERIESEKVNLFVTGRAGTGKSTLLQLVKDTSKKNLVVLAPTGVSALNVKGQTLHSFFGFPPRMLGMNEIKKRKNRSIYKKLQLMIIDEISMVRSDLLDNIDYFLRINREIDQPFGGVQCVFFGDLFQLPPVVSSDFEVQHFRDYYRSPYFFSAKIFERGFKLELFELTKIYRQENKHFIKLLESIRLNRIEYEDLETLNQRYIADFNGMDDSFITLTSTNQKAETINQKALDELPGIERKYLAVASGEIASGIFPIDECLSLKIGAQVMFLKNDPGKKYVNGSIGFVVDLNDDKVWVNLDETVIEVTPAIWEIIRYEDGEKIEPKTIGTFKQIPLKLAWAVTIHKAQGKTFDKVVIDLGKGAFENGQTYVALSRCKTLEGIVLKRPIQLRDIMTNEKVVDYYLQNS